MRMVLQESRLDIDEDKYRIARGVRRGHGRRRRVKEREEVCKSLWYSVLLLMDFLRVEYEAAIKIIHPFVSFTALIVAISEMWCVDVILNLGRKEAGYN
jgi:hypothetical protein